VVIGAGLGAMAGLANKNSNKVLESSISELKELEDYLADEAKKFI
jgi:hypothetical protein